MDLPNNEYYIWSCPPTIHPPFATYPQSMCCLSEFKFVISSSWLPIFVHACIVHIAGDDIRLLCSSRAIRKQQNSIDFIPLLLLLLLLTTWSCTH